MLIDKPRELDEHLPPGPDDLQRTIARYATLGVGMCIDFDPNRADYGRLIDMVVRMGDRSLAEWERRTSAENQAKADQAARQYPAIAADVA